MVLNKFSSSSLVTRHYTLLRRRLVMSWWLSDLMTFLLILTAKEKKKLINFFDRSNMMHMHIHTRIYSYIEIHGTSSEWSVCCMLLISRRRCYTCWNVIQIIANCIYIASVQQMQEPLCILCAHAASPWLLSIQFILPLPPTCSLSAYISHLAHHRGWRNSSSSSFSLHGWMNLHAYKFTYSYMHVHINNVYLKSSI